MLEQLVFDTFERLSEPARVRYATALKKSLRVNSDWNPRTLTGIPTPQDIARDGMDLNEQYELRVSVLKPVALEFLIQDAQVPERGLGGRLNWRNYEKRFGQPPCFIHQQPLIMMLTYAEWLHLVLDQPPQITLEILNAHP
jgi:hypothetical protein